MKEIKMLKKILKKRQKVTMSILVLFLITGKLNYGIDISEDLINKETIINNEGNGINIIADGLNIINYGYISGYIKNDFKKGNGIFQENVNGIKIFNKGSIRGEGFSDNYFPAWTGTGILSTNSTINVIENKGVVIGKAFLGNYGYSNCANGIYLENSSVENILNYGLISGIIEKREGGGATGGNGINIFLNGSVENILNQGIIKGHGIIETSPTGTRNNIGNGISAIDSFIKNIKNLGIISGYYTDNKPDIIFDKVGSGIVLDSIDEEDIGEVKNIGVISGYSNNLENAGNGIHSTNKNDITNLGIIKGSAQAVKGVYNNFINTGILAGQIITDSPYTNNGIAITLDNTGNIINIENGNTGIIAGKTVLNGNINIAGNDSSTSALETGANYDNYIINGAGTDKGALIVDENTELINSIINGYNTAAYIESGKTLTATDTTFNGGGLKNDVAVIKGDDGDNSLNILGNSIINGAVDLGEGADILTIAKDVQINGKLDGGEGADTLNLGEAQIAHKESLNLNIFDEIVGFENINTNGNVTLFETAKITGAENIILESGDLLLRIDPTIIKDGKMTGHALYENEGILASIGGKLIIGLNGLGEGATISMGGTTITSETNDNWWKDTDYIKTNSLVLDGKLSEDGKNIDITVLESIPIEPPVDPPIDPEPPIVIESLLYEKLNKVYQSIVSAGEIGNLANTTLLEDKTYNESLGGLLTILDQIYANNPYAYTLKSSRDSLKLFEDNQSYLTIKPQKSEMIVQGKAIYTGTKNDSSASGKNYYGFDTNHRNYKTTTNTVGGLATFEYGLSDKTSIGFIFGGNNQVINFKGSSEIKGNSLYLGTFAKTDIKNFKFMSGVGYQYTSADADRKASNKYDSFSTEDKYDINSLNSFVEAKYVYNAEQDWTVEPKVRLSYYYIDQDKVNEGYTPGQISMRTDSVNSNTADVEIGVDFVKSLYLNNGKLKNILSLGVINTIGDKSKELNGYILGKEKDGKKFDIQGVKLPKTSGKVSYNLELEQTNGLLYTAGLSLEFAKDYNRNVNATVGIGYKF